MSEKEYMPVDALFAAIDDFTDDGLAGTDADTLVRMAELRYGHGFGSADWGAMRRLAEEELEEHREDMKWITQMEVTQAMNEKKAIFKTSGLAEYTNGPDNSVESRHPHGFESYEAAITGAGAIALIGSDASGNDPEFMMKDRGEVL